MVFNHLYRARNLCWLFEKPFELLQALAGKPERIKVLAKRKARKDLSDVGMLFTIKLVQVQLYLSYLD
jgi:hypothetical protein